MNSQRRILTFCTSWLLIFFLHVLPKSVQGQVSGSFFILPKNFRTQMVNPAFVHSDNKITIAFPGLAGVSVENSGNFKISDLIHHDNTGKMVYDLDHFTGLGKKSYLAKQQLEIPLFYLAVPVNRGMVSFYLKEKVSSSFQLPAKGLLLLQNGNNNEQLTRFYSGNLKIQGIGYNEAAFGFSKKTSKNFQVGIRGKLLFGQALIEPTNWNYAAETFNDGQQILISSDGNAKVSGLLNFQKNKNNQVVAVITGPIKNYLTIFSNPGVAFDAGFTFQIDKNSLLAGNINDVGAIWFRKNSWKLAQSGSQLFRGINLSLATDSKKDNGYIAPIITMLNTKDSLRSVFEPFADSTKFLSALSPKLLLHYNRKLPNGFRAGITAQAVFLKPFVAHSLTFTVLHPVNQFSVWADISEHQLTSVSVGGGIQLNTKYAQLFAGIDNFPALYHPATQKAFAATLGMNFLIQQKKIKTKRRKRKGKTDEYFPFYLEHR